MSYAPVDFNTNMEMNQEKNRGIERSAIEVESLEQWNSILESTNNIPIVLKFSADFCGPCKVLEKSPKYLKLIEIFSENCLFLKINIEKMEAIANRFSISSVPTMIVLYNGEIVKQVTGASSSAVDEIASKLNSLV